MKYPAWVEKFRGKGREGRSSTSETTTISTPTRPSTTKKKRRAKKISTGYLGRISAQGLIAPRKEGEKKLRISAPLECGISHLLDVLGKDILDKLKSGFGETMGTEIFVLGKICVVEPSPLKRKEIVYRSSIDSVTYPGLAMSKSSLSSMLDRLGKLREQQVEFMRAFVTESEFIIFDGARLASPHPETSTPDSATTTAAS